MSEGDSGQDRQKMFSLEEERIKKELRNVPYGEIIKYQQSGKIPKNNLPIKKKEKKQKLGLQQPLPKSQKGAARQIKIMRRPQKQRKSRPKTIDPRFESYAGKYNSDLAKKSFSFIRDMQNTEADELKHQIKNKKIKQEDRQILLKQYGQLRNQMRNYELQQVQNQVKKKQKNSNFHLKKKQMKEKMEQAKLASMDDIAQKRRLKKKEKKIQKKRIIDRKRASY